MSRLAPERRTEAGIADAMRGFEVEMVPYGRTIGHTLDELYQSETDATVYLVPARTETQWFRGLARGEHRICLIRGRVRFGAHRGGAPFPSMLVYRGSRLAEFERAAVALGDVCAPWRVRP